MGKIYVKKCSSYMEPAEAIIEMYKNGSCIQEIENMFLDQYVKGYNADRIKQSILKYKQLVNDGEYECPTDIELDEPDAEYPDGVKENCVLYVKESCHYENVPQAIITWYENGKSISNMLEFLQDNYIHGYNATRIQNFIKAYKRLKKAGEYEVVIDVELELFKPQTAKSPSKNSTRAKKNAPKVKACEPQDEFDPFDLDNSSDCEEDDTTTEESEDIETSEDSIELSDPRFHTEAEIEQIVDDPLDVFKELNNHVMMIGQRLTSALLVTGPGGIGKSYSVKRVLSEFGDEKRDFVIMKGKCTASAMYDFLFKNHDKICVFDDCDSVLCDKEGIAILKGALDSGKDREISWNTRGVDMVDTFDCDNRKQVLKKMEQWSKRHGGRQGIPTHFQFEGSVIFISNMTRQEIMARDAALLTRCSVVDISITNEEFLMRLDALMPDLDIYDARGKNIGKKRMKQEVFNWISSDEFLNHPKMQGKSLDFRLFIKAYKARYAKIPLWKEMSLAS